MEKEVNKLSKNYLKPLLIALPAILLVIYLITTYAKDIYKIFWRNVEYKSILYLNEKAPEIDSIIKNLTINEKAGQLIFVDVDSFSYSDFSRVETIIKKIQPVGVIFKTDSIYKQIEINKRIIPYFKLKPFIGLNTDNGTADFIRDIQKYPSLTSVQAANNINIFNKYSKIVNQQCELLGFTVNFFPNIKLDKQQKSDSLYVRSVISNTISQLRAQNSKLMINFMECDGCENEISKKKEQNKYDIYKILIDRGITGFKITIDVPQDNSVEHAINQAQMLINEYNYEGLIIANIKDNSIINETNVLKLINSGIDLFLVNEKEAYKLFSIIEKLITTKKIKEKRLYDILIRINQAKYWQRYLISTNINQKNIYNELNSIDNSLLSRQITENSITLLKNDSNLLPFKQINKMQFCVLSAGNSLLSDFKEYLNLYSYVKAEHLDDVALKKFDIKKWLQQNGKFNQIILALSVDEYLKSNLIKEKIDLITSQLAKNQHLTLVLFGFPKDLAILKKANAVLQVYDQYSISQQLAAQILFGGSVSKGGLPYKINDSMKFNFGIKNLKQIRLKYTIPEEAGLKSSSLAKIDSIIRDAIQKGAMPGCQVFIAKDFKVIYNKSFGSPTYSKSRGVMLTDLYDIASITKVAATTLATMKLYEEGRIGLADKLERFFKDTKIDYTNIKPDTIINIDTLYFADKPVFKKILDKQDTLNINDSMFVAFDTIIVTVTPKLNIFKVRVSDLLNHQSGISPSLPILPFIKFKDKGINKYNDYFSNRQSKNSTHQIAANMFLNNNYFDTLWTKTKQIKVYSRRIYQYSDVNMILLQNAIDSMNNVDFVKYLDEKFYKPLGLQTMTYLPLKKFSKDRIIPTATDEYWRQQSLQGYVHDPSAALLGCVAGNAGLFSNANDLGILFQMLLNKGTYGGEVFLKPQTVNQFTIKQPEGYRGLGFDKPCRKNIIAPSASERSFGHTGFTGTCVWVDPVNNLVYVFLSNRVCPSEKNWKLNTLLVRQKVHQVVYDAIKEFKQNTQVN